MNDRIFSKRCANCREKAVELTNLPVYTIDIEHDGRKYPLVIRDFVVPQCSKCGHIAIDHTAEVQINAAFHELAGLLRPDEILAHRQRLMLTQTALADALGVSVSTLSRWETGAQIQQRSLDKFMRLYFRLPEVRSALAETTSSFTKSAFSEPIAS